MINLLRTILAPPLAPSELPPRRAWPAVEEGFARLPQDYKEFIETYGSGYIGEGYLSVFNPFSKNQYLDLVYQAENVRTAFASLKREHPLAYAFDFFPALGGLLPFGVNVDGAYLLWQTAGHPDAWSIAVLACDAPRIEGFQMGMVEWLAKILSGQIRCSFFPADLLQGPVTFTPHE
jgi:hypothetical protein